MTYRQSSKFLINAYKNQYEKALRDKVKKKGVLTKIVMANKSRTNVLGEIFRQSDSFNTINSYERQKSEDSPPDNDAASSNEKYLEKFRKTTFGKMIH